MSQPEALAFLCHPYHRGGVTRWMADAAIALTKRGITVYFVTVAPKRTFYSGRTAETMIQLLQKQPNQVQIVSEPAGIEFEFGSAAYKTHIYQRLLAAHVPVGTPIILSDDAEVWGAAAAMHRSYPLVGVLHSDEGHYYTIANKYKAQVDIFPCVSARVHKTLQGKCPDIAPARISTIPCGIQLPPVNKRTHTSDLLKLIYVGRITEYQKRVSDLVKIAQQLVKHNVAFELTIAGDGGADKTALEQKITGNSLDKYVRFTGWLAKDKIQEYLYESDVMVLTSDFEGTPISMMEALASGCGFTGTRVSGIEDCEDHPAAADCFRIYDVGDIEDAAVKIQQIAAIPLQTRQLAARRIAESEFSMDTCLDRYLAAIATIKTKEYVMTTTTLPPAALIKSRLTAELRALKMKLRG